MLEAGKLAEAVDDVLRHGPTYTSDDYGTQLRALEYINEALELMQKPYRLFAVDGYIINEDQDEFPCIDKIVVKPLKP